MDRMAQLSGVQLSELRQPEVLNQKLWLQGDVRLLGHNQLKPEGDGLGFFLESPWGLHSSVQATQLEPVYCIKTSLSFFFID